MDGQDLEPPLPPRVLDVLTQASFCYLATVESEGPISAPHLCLMRFTWVPAADTAAGGVLVLSTRRDSRKHAALVANPRVAVLIHAAVDAPDGGEPGELSVTVYGEAAVVDGVDAERLRALHLRRNPGYAQFITGDGIAVVTVRLRTARVCDVLDRVHVHSFR